MCAVSLPLIGFILFSLVPLAISFISMFTTMEYYDLSTMTWNEFETFKIVFSDQDLYKSLLVTVMLASSQFISLTVALFISLFALQETEGQKDLSDPLLHSLYLQQRCHGVYVDDDVRPQLRHHQYLPRRTVRRGSKG